MFGISGVEVWYQGRDESNDLNHCSETQCVQLHLAVSETVWPRLCLSNWSNHLSIDTQKSNRGAKRDIKITFPNVNKISY
jgi:hypothetical protein